jgi:hypothetical protein
VTLRFDVSAADAEVIRATLARLRLQGGFGADCDDGVLLADLARNGLVEEEQLPPTAEGFRVSIHHCPRCEDTHLGDPQAPSAPEHTGLACAKCDAQVLNLTAPRPRLTPGASGREITAGCGLLAAAASLTATPACASSAGAMSTTASASATASRRRVSGSPRAAHTVGRRWSGGFGSTRRARSTVQARAGQRSRCRGARACVRARRGITRRCGR